MRSACVAIRSNRPDLAQDLPRYILVDYYSLAAVRIVYHLLIEHISKGIRRTWKRLLDGHCGIVNVADRHPRFAELPCQVAAIVPRGTRKDGGWKASEWLSRDVS
jgi:hypothetical protein